jgi:hypothetical protein
MIIGFSGKFRSGKDTAASIASKYLKDKGYFTERIAFADSVKDVVEILTGEKRVIVDDNSYSYPVYDFTIEQKNTFLDSWGLTIGQMLQKVGTECIRDHLSKNAWINSLYSKYLPVKDTSVVLTTDVRFKNEAEFIYKLNDSHIVRIVRDVPDGSPVTRDVKHESETSLDDYQNFSFVVENNSTLIDLEKKVKNIVDLIITPKA